MFKFIDLFAGIGGIRTAFEEAGGKCVFSSEWDKYSCTTYEANFKEKPSGDIQKIESSEIPAFNVLCAGFPCQPFSLAGVSKKISMGKAHGFDDAKQGNLFFDIIRIVNFHKPEIVFLENVKNLLSHDKGRTFKVIKEALEAEGYNLSVDIFDAANFVPQHRERIIIVGCLNNFIELPCKSKLPEANHKIADILEPKVDPKYTLSDKLWHYLQEHAKKHKALGNGFGFGLVNKQGISRTLSARYHKDGSEILVPQKGKNPRRLTPRECARLMGYPDDFIIPVSNTQAYRQFGNSVCVPMMKFLAQHVINHSNLNNQKSKRREIPRTTKTDHKLVLT